MIAKIFLKTVMLGIALAAPAYAAGTGTCTTTVSGPLSIGTGTLQSGYSPLGSAASTTSGSTKVTINWNVTAITGNGSNAKATVQVAFSPSSNLTINLTDANNPTTPLPVTITGDSQFMSNTKSFGSGGAGTTMYSNSTVVTTGTGSDSFNVIATISATPGVKVSSTAFSYATTGTLSCTVI